jgi:hypothetical protein
LIFDRFHCHPLDWKLHCLGLLEYFGDWVHRPARTGPRAHVCGSSPDQWGKWLGAFRGRIFGWSGGGRLVRSHHAFRKDSTILRCIAPSSTQTQKGCLSKDSAENVGIRQMLGGWVLDDQRHGGLDGRWSV